MSGVAGRGAQTYRLEGTNSVIEVHVGTTGALGFLGHGHLIQAPIQQGVFVYEPGDPSRSSVELAVDARALRVVDPGLSPQDRSKVQATMESSRVLGCKEYPAITFKSTRIEAGPDKGLRIEGTLTIRGTSRPVTVHVTLEQTEPDLRASGESQFKQSEFGIRPVAVALGTVRVKDGMTLTFRVVGQPVQAADTGARPESRAPNP